MKLSFWKIAGLPTHRDFAVSAVTVRSAFLRVSLLNVLDQRLRLSLTFPNHRGFMICDEFGMDRHIVRSSDAGSNFFMAEQSEFMDLMRRGKREPHDWSKTSSFVIVDSDYWIEVLSDMPPEIGLLDVAGGAVMH